MLLSSVFRDHRFIKYLLLGIIATASAALPAHAQSVVGSLDVVEQQAVLGWTCLPGDPNTRPSIELWAWDPAMGAWAFIGSTIADKQRIDVGNAGVCGTGPGSFHHGFEWAIYPDNILIKNKNYSVYAYYRPTGQFLNGSGRQLGFPESGLPTSGYWRTDFDDPNSRQPSLLGCVWPFTGPSDPTNILPGAGPSWPNGFPVPLGYSTPSFSCITYDPQAVASPWPHSNAATNAPLWPNANFWVVSANYEPAYTLLNSGPPGQSQPLNAGLYSLSTDGSNTSFRLKINNAAKPANLDGIPYLSFGAQMGRGSAGPLLVFDPNAGDVNLQFTATKNVDIVGTRNYHLMAVFIEAMWGGVKRMVAVTLQQQATARKHWNWNAYPSFFYPGAEIDFISLDDLSAFPCGINAGAKLDGSAVGMTRSYSIPLGGVFQCATNGVAILGWTAPRPAWIPLFITGVHFAIELADGDHNSVLDVTYSTPRFVR